MAALVMLLGFAPTRPVEACSTDFCAAVPRWQDLELRSISPVPLDGALVFAGNTGAQEWFADLEPHIRVEVKLGGATVAGETTLVEDLPGLIVWRPDAPLQADSDLTIDVEIDNDAIASDSDCGPGQLRADFSVHTAKAKESGTPAPAVTGEMKVATGSTRGARHLATGASELWIPITSPVAPRSTAASGERRRCNVHARRIRRATSATPPPRRRTARSSCARTAR